MNEKYLKYVLWLCERCLKYGNHSEVTVARLVKYEQKDWYTDEQWYIVAAGAARVPKRKSPSHCYREYRNTNKYGCEA